MAMTAIVGPPTYPAPMHAMRFVDIIKLAFLASSERYYRAFHSEVREGKSGVQPDRVYILFGGIRMR